MQRQLVFVLRVGLCAVFLLAQSGVAQQVFESQRLRFQADVVATGLKQPSAMVFLPDGRALLVERQRGVDVLDPKSGALTPLEGGPEALIGTETGVRVAARPATLTGEDAGFHDVALHPEFSKNGGSISVIRPARGSAVRPW